MLGLILLFLLLFFLGASIGSFLLAWSSVLEKKEKGYEHRSHCSSCKHVLSPIDLIPLLSFLWLRGKCRYCKTLLTPTLFLVELTTGILFVLAGIQIVGSEDGALLLCLTLVRNLIVLSSLVLIFIHDAQYQHIPDIAVIPPTIIAFALNIALGYSWLHLFGGIALASGLFLLQYIATKKQGIGEGDILFGILIGASLGFTHTLIALCIAYIIGATTALFLIFVKQRSRKTAIALGPFLSIGTAVTLLWGDDILAWYLSLS